MRDSPEGIPLRWTKVRPSQINVCNLQNGVFVHLSKPAAGQEGGNVTVVEQLKVCVLFFRAD
jgi:hypothetical protein